MKGVLKFMTELQCYPKFNCVRVFDIEAISIPIVYNKYGDYDPDGMMYVLKKNSKRIQNEAKERLLQNPPQPYKEVQPLVIRANAGDEIQINFYNRLNRRASIHVQGLRYNVLTSDGAEVGYNPDTATSDFISYKWYAEREGVYLFSDMGDTRSGEDGTNVHGLFGAVIVEKPQSRWFDPVSGEEIESGLFADVYNPIEPSFREYAVFFHDELEIKNKDGKQPVDPHTGLPNGTTGISYRSEPMRNRLPLEHMHEGVTDEDISMSSWSYGDPAPPILRAYVGDPSKIRLIHGGVKETHVFHLHNHQWKLEPDDPKSTIIDSISISPQECYTLDILYGAGSFTKMTGDAIFHCHLYPHFHEGMWTLWRIFDRLEDGTGVYPDGTQIERLLPLKDRPCPPEKDIFHPGYPNYINREFGERPLQPPLGVLDIDDENKIFPTPLEVANFVPDFIPGALYSETCPCKECDKVKVFELAMVQADVVYNRYGWHDPQGRFFVLKEEIERHGTLDNYLEKVNSGKIKPQPLVIRANAGDCIEIRMTNFLPDYIEESPFQLKTLTDIAGFHIHLVKFDTIVSDGAANGWNNIAGARKYETLIERFNANEELNTVFFHDHLFANSHQQHGLFGALIVEPAGSVFLNPKNGRPLKSGANAVIKRVDGSSYREFAMFVHDFALLFDKDNKPLNPPEHPGSDDDPGVMGISYRCEPMTERLKKKNDPSHIFGSRKYGDPATPILETYPGDPIVIRLLDGAHEEQHAFNINGMSWRKEITDPVSPIVQEQTIGISEAFNVKIDEYYDAGDYLYYFGGIDDLWLGLWGIIRAHKCRQKHLMPLCNKNKPVPKPSCPPKDAVVRKFEIAAIQTNIKYNRYGDHDPEGMVFVPLEYAEDVKCGRKNPVPLILRANAGDWIEVTLHNMFDKPVIYHDYPSVPIDMPHKPSERVSLSPQFLKFCPQCSSGVNVGYNKPEQTAGRGEYVKYLWHADKEYGACLLNSFGDLRNHRYHGLFGAIIIEPPASIYYHNILKIKKNYEEQSVITSPEAESFREFVLFAHNGIRLLDKKGNVIKTTEQGAEGAHGAPDHEDTGEKGYNYRSERFFNRLKRNPIISKVFSSRVHGDPSTPLLKAYTKERVIIRLLMPADKPRNIGFVIHGHNWRAQPDDPFSTIIPAQGAISVGGVYNIELKNGASNVPGDYLYRSGSLRWDVESGMWGILRIMNRNIKYQCERICRNVGNWWEKHWYDKYM